ncbi:MAG: coproporphyrinogen dehydrogenase HemZ [Clostridia bacterium]|nr:coproporphyrinogen dehydrogenase HemZ [Clostridia bacterium]
MKITVEGDLNPYYIETIAMTFFPGEKFRDEEDPRLTARVSLFDRDDGSFSAVDLTDKDGGTASGEDFEPWRADAHAEGADRTRKLSSGRAFFKAAVALTGYRPPWGIMTGVRPSKLATEFLTSGLSEEASAEEIVNSYLAIPEKVRLAVGVAGTERELIKPGDSGKCSVYIAIPFCPTRCDYCSFVSYTSPRLLALIPEYLKRLRDDIAFTAELIRGLGLEVSTVYIGGGTPTVLDPVQLDSLLASLAPLTENCSEYTLESGRPDTITAEKMRIASSHGVGRVSVNPQTLNDRVLEAIGRKHTAARFFEAYGIARNAGIGVVNVDLIAGLPGDDPDSFSDTCEQIVKMRPENLTVHTFTVKKSAKFKEEGAYDREGRDAERSVSISSGYASSAGYRPYYMYRQKNTVGNLENVGYALPGYECMYNVYMMEEIHTVFACGASAVTKLVSLPGTDGYRDIKRIFESKYPYEYLRESEDGTLAEKRKKLTSDIVSFYREHNMV